MCPDVLMGQAAKHIYLDMCLGKSGTDIVAICARNRQPIWGATYVVRQEYVNTCEGKSTRTNSVARV